MLLEKLLRKKNVASEIKENSTLAKRLGLFDLIGFGIGGIIGAGIFILTGVAARTTAGPAVVVSFLICAFACALSALCYAEFASLIPVTGSAYVYTYVSIGEFPAFIVCWALILEYILSSSILARGWPGYLDALVSSFGGRLPPHVFNYEVGSFDFSFLSCILVLFMTMFILYGIKNSSLANWIITGISLIVVIFVIIYGGTFVDTRNWNNFAPYGVPGVLEGAGLVFFSYIGFDCLANYAEESVNPQRDMPISIIGSIFICALLYAIVSLIICGMVPYNQISVTAPFSAAFALYGSTWAESIVSIGALCAITSSLLFILNGGSRLVFSLSRDGLLPSFLSKLSRRKIPYITVIVIVLMVVVTVLLLTLSQLVELVAFGTLLSMTIVCSAILVLRNKFSRLPVKGNAVLLSATIFIYALSTLVVGFVTKYAIQNQQIVIIPILFVPIFLTGLYVIYYFHKYVGHNPADSTHYKMPFVPLIPLLSIFTNMYLIASLQWITWALGVSWMVFGIIIYFAYGFRHSKAQLAEEGFLLGANSNGAVE